MTEQTIACVYIPDLVLTSGDAPVALIDYGQRTPDVAAASEAARAAGVQPGVTLARARSLLPALKLRPLNHDRTLHLRDKLLDVLFRYSNAVDIDPGIFPQAGIFWLGLGHVPDDAALRLGERLASALRRDGVSARIGIARQKFPALAAACHSDGIRLLPRGMEAAAMQMPLPQDDLSQLNIAGVPTLEQFAALNDGMHAQLGRKMQRWADGETHQPNRPQKFPATEHAGVDFERAVEAREDIHDALADCAHLLVQRLRRRGGVAFDIHLTLYGETGSAYADRRRSSTPLAERYELVRAFHAMFGMLRPDEPISGVGVRLTRLQATAPTQLTMFE